MKLSTANAKRLQELIAQYKVEKLQPWIARHASECILLHVTDADEYLRQGNCRIGGVPDLRTGFKWARNKDGNCLSFIMQIDLAALPQLQTKELPKSGHLFIFVGNDSNSSNVELALIYDP